MGKFLERTREGERAAVADVGDVPAPASRCWRDFDPDTLTGKLRSLATELTTYRDRLDEILAHRGEYVVIRGREVIGYAPDIEGAIELVKPLRPAPCLVKQVVEFEPVAHLGGAA